MQTHIGISLYYQIIFCIRLIAQIYEFLIIDHKTILKPMQDNMKESDWQRVDTIIVSLDLNKDELQALDCFLSGKGLFETARTIHYGISTAFASRKKMKKKHLQVIYL